MYGRIRAEREDTGPYMATHKLTAEIITAAVEGFEQQKLRIDAQIAELRKMLTGTPTDPAATPEVPRGGRRKRVPKWRRSGPLPGEQFGVSLSLFSGVVVRNGPEPSRARRCWARRSEPLTARTVLR